MRKVTKFWKMKSGEKIRICDMSDSHLLNTIAMIERVCQKVHAQEISACASIVFQGEQACIEQDNFLEHSSYEDYIPELYYDLCNESYRRNLTQKESGE